VATNFFFRDSDEFIPEQILLQDLTDEMIQIHGMDVIYILRNTNYIDPLYDEAPTSSFTVAVPIEMYLESYEGFQGDGDVLSKYGLSTADKMNLSISRRRFAQDIGSNYDLIRPREGDLVFFPLTKGVFEIKFVEHEATFYQTGTLQYYQLQLEKFNYNSEIFNTGVAVIDQIQTTYSVADSNFWYLTEDDYDLVTEDGYDLVGEDYVLETIDEITQNEEFETLANTFVDWSIGNPFGDVDNV
jgi:hypothetical protein